MKKFFHFSIFLVLAFVITWALYHHFSYSTLPESTSRHLTNESYHGAYSGQIDQARQYLITIPSKINVPSFSVAIGLDRALIWSEAIGYQDIENEMPATPNTIYRIGSTSKAVTAILAAKMYQDSLLYLDFKISDQISNYPPKDWDFTPRQLLSHSAGVPDYEDLKISGLYHTLCNCKNYKSVTESLNLFHNIQLQYEPGTQFEYTSLGFVLLSAYLEEISSSDFLSLLHEKLLDPLGMDETFGDHSTYQTGVIATFYETNGSKYRKWKTFGFIPGEIDLSYKWAGGGIMSTPTDLVKMGNAVLTDSSFLRPSTVSEFFEPQILSNSEINPQNYALGWRSYKEYEHNALPRKVWIVHHGGVSKGSMNLLVLFPDYDMAIDASINTRTEDFPIFWEEVIKLASFFLPKN